MTAAQRTLTTTSPGPTLGWGCSVGLRTELSPYEEYVMAFMVLFPVLAELVGIACSLPLSRWAEGPR
ncbi:hypothetical protein GCM10010326_07110 [Streptomyces xanthochromogenes]|uniref:Uncharacterized protein n=1 Tax=Streptomyces xanthochromogenes TaxID=67384 RepID=A0ABQ2ZKR6_9ACTN|nr:hypothetical protein GCM10010326_07110 [Streptomyces xanthochromogenes]